MRLRTAHATAVIEGPEELEQAFGAYFTIVIIRNPQTRGIFKVPILHPRFGEVGRETHLVASST